MCSYVADDNSNWSPHTHCWFHSRMALSTRRLSVNPHQSLWLYKRRHWTRAKRCTDQGNDIMGVSEQRAFMLLTLNTQSCSCVHLSASEGEDEVSVTSHLYWLWGLQHMLLYLWFKATALLKAAACASHTQCKVLDKHAGRFSKMLKWKGWVSRRDAVELKTGNISGSFSRKTLMVLDSLYTCHK